MYTKRAFRLNKYEHLHRTFLDGNASTILKKRGLIVDKRKGKDNKESKMTLTKTQDVLFGREFKRADRAGQK
nr:YfhE family protein [Bacillus sp. NTK071]